MTSEFPNPPTQLQLDLIEGRVKPKTNKEWVFIQENCNDIVPPIPIPNAQRLSKPLPDLPLLWWQRD